MHNCDLSEIDDILKIYNILNNNQSSKIDFMDLYIKIIIRSK